jgi:adenine-specific DNA-methyltransferase
MSKFSISNRRYTGSKSKLIDWINRSIQSNAKSADSSFADIFAGTGVVAANNTDSFEEIIINDFLHSNNVIYKGFFEKGRWSEKKIINHVKSYADLTTTLLKENYFSRNFGGKFYSLQDAKIIGCIREDIERNRPDFTAKESNILLASLLYSADKAANTVGHYDAYRIRPDIEDRFEFKLIQPIHCKATVSIYREDANQLVKKINPDLIYIDPPYNSRQYSRFYHVLENLVQWKKPELFGVAMKPEPENMSEYCKVAAFDNFSDLIANISSKKIIVSYNNTYNSKSSSSKNKISHEQILSVLSEKGPTEELSIEHAHFNAGKTNFSDHREFLFITTVA